MNPSEFVLHLVIIVLAAWRISSLIATEDGPLDVFLLVRVWFGQRFDDESRPYYPSWGEVSFGLGLSDAQVDHPLRYPVARAAYVKWDIGRGWCCVWCNSVWIGFFLVPLYLSFPYATVSLCLLLAVSSAVLLVEKLER